VALFAGRDDVYATRWSNPRTGKAGWSPAVVGGPANAKRPDREYLPLTDAVIEAHLSDLLVGGEHECAGIAVNEIGLAGYSWTA
jgi:hypothetical protein